MVYNTCMPPLLKVASQRYLLFLARRAIEYSFEKAAPLKISEKAVPHKELLEKRGCFVSLHTASGQLRGCIGTIEPIYPLYQGVIENALSAAFRDPRFPVLTYGELDNVVFEISVLSVPELLSCRSSEELISLLEKTRPGVVLEMGVYRATYLPQVWESFSSAADFLSSLCQKAGLPPSVWKEENVKIYTYTAQVFKEKAPGELDL